MIAHTRKVFTLASPVGLPCEENAGWGPIVGTLRRLGKAARYISSCLLVVTCFTAVCASSASAQGRVALVLGAEKYQHFKASQITIAQSTALEQALRKQGFDVTLAANPGNAAARAALSDFSRKADTADFALIVAAGHFATYRGQSFYLPTNARVRRATDLFSRGLSVSNIADIAHRAKSGAFLMLMTVPDIPSTIAGVGAQPGFSKPPPANVVAVFSTSGKVPVSRVDSVSAQAMKDVIEVAGEKPMMLAALLDGASAGGTGSVIGEAGELNLSVDASRPKTVAQQNTANAQAESEAERKARIIAEKRLSEAEDRALMAEQRARAAEAKAKRELAAAVAAKREAENKARQTESQAKIASAQKQQPPAATTPSSQIPNIQSLQVVEALLGRGQRKVIQRILKTKGFYQGPIDAIFGDQTRQAIRDFQRDAGAQETGYLTPDQFQQLVASR